MAQYEAQRSAFFESLLTELGGLPQGVGAVENTIYSDSPTFIADAGSNRHILRVAIQEDHYSVTHIVKDQAEDDHMVLGQDFYDTAVEAAEEVAKFEASS